MPSIFTKIVNGDIPCYKITETEKFLAFLDIRPMMEGHTLCIPKQEVDYYFALATRLENKVSSLISSSVKSK
ncbi:MAG: HIT domain-containing protein, partial [Bacteroidota bacterium]